MKYVDNLEQAANHLRLAVPMMVKHAIPPNPHNYAIWYHYVAGLDPELKKALDNSLLQEGGIDSSDSDRLYSTYISPDSEAERIFQESLCRLIEKVGQTVDSTSSETRELSSELAVAASKLQQSGLNSPDAQQLRRIVDDLNRNIDVFTRSTSDFQSQLDAAQSEIDELKDALAQSRWAARHDSLTSLHNRAAFQQQLEYLHTNSRSAFLILMDLDHFKKINDNFGHNAGDKVLQAVGKILNLGADVFSARFGGEEFAILLDKTNLPQVQKFAEKLRTTLAGKKLRYNGNPAGITSVTASFGITYLDPMLSTAECIEKADQALYEAKRAGRNCVICSETAAFSG